MNKYKFIEYLHHPNRVTADQQNELSEVVTEYPYFQTARTLLAKVKKSRQDTTAGHSINSASLYVFDRKYLKKYLESELFFIEPKAAQKSRQENSRKPTEKIVAPPTTQAPQKPAMSPAPATRPRPTSSETEKKVAPPKAQAPQKPATSTARPRPTSPPNSSGTEKRVAQRPAPTQQTPPPQKKPVEKVSDEALTPPEAPKTSDLDQLIAEVFADMAELRKSKARFVEWQEKSDMEEAIEKAMFSATDDDYKSPTNEASPSKEEPATETTAEASTEQETPPAQPKAKETPPIEAAKAETEEPRDKEPAKVDTSTDAPAETVTTKEEKPVKATDDKASEEPAEVKKPKTKAKPAAKKATPTKKTASTAKKVVKKSVKSTTKPKATAKPPTPAAKEAPPKEEEATSLPKGGKKSIDHEKIIDEFIEKQPSISQVKPVDPHDQKDDLAQGSTRFHADIASEYLAEIYIEQGKNDRAIEIYKNLGLKFPEKKSYFAGLIEKLK